MINKSILNKSDFENALKESLKEIDITIKSHFGVLLTMYKRLQFEKWFQIELIKSLVNHLKDFDAQIHIEYELNDKLSKRGQTIDIVILKGNIEFIGLELKIAPTNYSASGFDKKGKRITDIIDDFISDIDKTKEFNHSYSLALIFPFPTNKNHRNYIDFEKQELRMKSKCNLFAWDGLKMDDFITRYYLLYKENIF